jgi:kynurenine formamidase
LEGWVDLTLDWGDSPGGHGTLPLKIFWQETQEASDRGAMQWQLSPHTVTHLDLPWALDPLRLGSRSQNLLDIRSREAQEYISRLAAPHTMQAVFIDLTDLAGEAGLLENGTTITLLFDKSEEELVHVIEKIRITPDVILERTSNVSLCERLVVLHTGWTDLFMPKGDDMRSFFWEGGHTWLTHPWLDQMAVETICNHQALGVAIDAPMADCPMYIARNLSVSASRVSNAARKILNSRDVPNIQPVHSAVLGRFMLLVESLKIPEEIKSWYRTSKSSFETTLFVAGLHFHLLPDAIPLKLLARAPTNKQGEKKCQN